MAADLRVGFEAARLNVLAYRGETQAAETIFRELEPCGRSSDGLKTSGSR